MKKPQKKQPARKRTTKKNSNIKNDAIKAFWLVCAIVAVSILISFAIVIIWKGTINNEQLTINNEQLTINNEQLTINNEQLTINNEQLTINNENRTNNSTAPRNPTPELRNPTPEPRNPTPEPRNPTPEPRTQNPEPRTQNPQAAVTPTNTVTTSTTRSTEIKGDIAFVIDDAGNNLQELEPFLKIDAPLTIAVLPGLPHSAEAARRIRAAGKEVILHQPMEAVGGQNPGPSSIYSNMSKDEIRSMLKKNIEEVGPVVGMNNHQGSKITMEKEMMEVILSFCNENNIYFLDSRTTAETAAPVAARRLGIKIAERDTFLDNEQDKESMLRYMATGLARAQRNGKAIMIGHTWSPALAPLLTEQIPILTIQGYTIKTVSEMLK